MTSLISFFLQGAGLGLSAGAAPGPLQAYLISETITEGWRQSLPLIFVPLLSDLPIILLTTFILDQLPNSALQVISIIGGFFVLYLAWGFWRQWKMSISNPTEFQPNNKRPFLKAVLMNLLNPNPYIFWAFVSGPILLSALEINWTHAFTFLVGFYGVFMMTMVFMIILFHQTRRLGSRAIHIIQLCSIGILIIFGIFLIKEGLFG
jgi:threonine/homoserine/homoserine lactone efflux protein